MSVTYCTTKQVWEELGAFKRVPDRPDFIGNREEVGTGDGSTSTFYLDNFNVIVGTYTFYYGSADNVSVTTLTETTHYTLNKDDGILTLTSAGITAVGTNKIFAKYWSASISDSTVENRINEAEEEIDEKCHHVWRTVQLIDEEIHALEDKRYNPYDEAQVIYLDRYPVTQLSAAAGDVLQVWDGSQYINYLSSKTEGFGNDYWFNYELGRLYLPLLLNYKEGVKIKYRHGDSTVPKDIRQAAILMAARSLVIADDRNLLIRDGTNALKAFEKIQVYSNRINELLDRHTYPLVGRT